VEFLHALFDGTEGTVEIRCIEDKKDGDIDRAWLSLDGLIGNLEHIYTEAFKEGRAVFYGVLPRESGKGTAEDTKKGRVVWCDIDFKDVPEQDAWKRMLDFETKPNIVVHSGRGLHLYWLLDLLVAPATLAECAKKVAYALGADHCHDAARILRLPGSQNLKACWSIDGSVYTPNHDAPVCKVLLFETTVKTPLISLLNLPEAPNTDAGARGDYERKNDFPSEVVSDRVLSWLEKDAHLLDLWSSKGKESGDTSNSGYDISFAFRLVKLGIADVDELDAAVYARPRTDTKKKGTRDVYRAVDAALGTLTATNEVGIDDTDGIKAYFDRQKGPVPGQSPHVDVDPGEAAKPKTPEALASEEADDEVKRIQKILADWEGKLSDANELLSQVNEIRRQRKIVVDRIKAAEKLNPLKPDQLYLVPGVAAALEDIATAKNALATAQDEDKHLSIAGLTPEDVAARREVIAAARRNVRVAEQFLDVAIATAQATARQPAVDAATVMLADVDALEAAVEEARSVISTVKEGKARLKTARADAAKAKKAMQVAAGAFTPNSTVYQDLKMDTYGGIRGNKVNVHRIFDIEPHFKEAFSYDTFTGRLYYRDEPMADGHEFSLASLLEDVYDIPHVATEIVRGAADLVGKKNAFHAVTKYLDGLTWDGVERVGTLLKKGFNAYAPEGDAGLLDLMSEKFMISMVARAYDPGCDMHTMLVLSGGEHGTFKSTGLRALVSPPCAGKHSGWFSDTHVELGTRAAAEQMQGKWMYEIAELHSFNPRDIEKIKAALSSASDNYRFAYGHYAETLARGSAFVGTTNMDYFLDDPTGSRRFMCARIKTVDKDWIDANRDQLWAEAVSMYKRGVAWWWPLEEKRRLENSNKAFETADPWLPKIEALIADKVTESFPARLAAALVLEAGAKGIPANILLQHLQMLSTTIGAAGGIKSKDAMALRAHATSAVTVLKPVVADTGGDSVKTLEMLQRLSSEAAVFCTMDAYDDKYIGVQTDRRNQKHEAQISHLFRKLGCLKYGMKNGAHPALRLRGVRARWYLPPTLSTGTEKVVEDLLTAQTPPAN
jgi:predicted P-loop ATPase